jgi:PTH1 family peptidyl-tRNA hydrolase
MFLIVGLGNPGLEYADTRHNLGFKVIDELAKRLNLSSFKNKCSALIAEGKLADHKVILAAPQTFMNNSGQAVRELAGWYKVPAAKVIVIYDDVDLEVGQLRVREKGNAGGHHGVESLIAHLGTTDFPRVRLGIGREEMTGDVAEYVLRKVPPAQRLQLEEAVILAADAVEAIVANGVAAAMNKFNDRQDH